MATEIEKREQSLAIPNIASGEVIDLREAETDQIAEAIYAMREQESRYREWKRAAGDELLRRMDADASWTLRTGQYEVKGDSPAPTREVDLEPLRTELAWLYAEAKISDEAVRKAVEEVITYKVRWSGLDAIRKLGGEVKERIDQHIREVPKQRRMPTVNLSRPE